MKAAVYAKNNSRKRLEIRELERPTPGDDEVLIRVRAASVNPLDWRLKSKRPGVDVAGEVFEVGPAVTRFKAGDPVFGAGKGSFAEYACAAEDKLVAKPEGLDFDAAAAIPIAGITAWNGLHDKGRVQPGQKVLINGAAGGIGTFAVQIAKSLGAHVTGVCSTRNIELVCSLGAERAIDYTREDFTEGSERYDLILDNVGNRSLTSMKRVLSPNGRCVMAGAPKQMWAVFMHIFKAFLRSALLRQNFHFFVASINRESLTSFCELVAAGKVIPVIDRRYSLADAADAIAYVEEGHAPAKVVIVVRS